MDMKIYTRTGDAGETSLYSGERVMKCCPRVDVYGEADELQASLGLARAFATQPETGRMLYGLQQTLVSAMAELATVGGAKRIGVEDVEGLEQEIDEITQKVSSGFSFLIPGENPCSAALHVARTVARRCERALILFSEDEEVSPEMLAFFNRISDLCYILARYEDECQDDTV